MEKEPFLPDCPSAKNNQVRCAFPLRTMCDIWKKLPFYKNKTSERREISIYSFQDDTFSIQ